MQRTDPQSIQQLSTPHFLACLAAVSPAQQRRLLRIRCARDLELFASWFFPQCTRLPFSRFHRDMLALHRDLAPHADAGPQRRGRRIVVAAPRGSAKTTLLSGILLNHDLLYRRERYIVLLSATLKQAAQRLRTLRTECRANDRLRAMFPKELARPALDRAQSLEYNDVRMDVFGAGAEIRGLLHGPWRPTKIILDDVEHSEAVESAEQRAKLADWYAEVIENLGDTTTHIVVIGTVLHRESLLSRLLARPDFEVHRYSAVECFSPRAELWDEWRRRLTDLADPRREAAAREFLDAHRPDMLRDTRVLWPEKEDYPELMRQLVLRGRRAFFQEKQNEPLAGDACVFRPGEIRRALARPAELLDTNPPASTAAPRPIPLAQCRILAFLDPALGRGGPRRTGDNAALAIVAIAPDATLYALEVRGRPLRPSEQVADLFEAWQRWRFETLGFEANGFQELLGERIEDERRRIAADTGGVAPGFRLEFVQNRRPKFERIAALEPLFLNGWLRVCDGASEEFWRELEDFPGGAHDDLLDALAGACALAKTATVCAPVSLPEFRPAPAGRKSRRME